MFNYIIKFTFLVSSFYYLIEISILLTFQCLDHTDLGPNIRQIIPKQVTKNFYNRVNSFRTYEHL